MGGSRKRSHGSRAVVTGAGSGIGRAFALELAVRGGKIVCSDVDLATAQQTARAIEERGGRALATRCDVASESEVRALAESAASWLGAVDLVVNNAGIGMGGRVVGETSLDDWRRTIDVNLWGVIHGCHVFAPRLRDLGHGGIINVASSAGFAAAPWMAAYNVTKAGVMALSETMAAELAGSGVVITVLCPTFVKTNIVSAAPVDTATSRLGENLMKWTGVSPESVVKKTLRAHDRGELYVLPQIEARALWRMKRAMPSTYARGLGVIVRTAGRFGRGGS